MKKTYINPQMEIVKLQQSQALCVTSMSNANGLQWETDGIEDSDEDC